MTHIAEINDVLNPANRYFKVIKRNHNIGRSVVGLCVVAALCWPQVGTDMSNVLFTQVMTSSPSPRVSGGAFTALGIMGKTLGEFQIKPAPAFASRYNAFWDRNVWNSGDNFPLRHVTMVSNKCGSPQHIKTLPRLVGITPWNFPRVKWQLLSNALSQNMLIKNRLWTFTLSLMLDFQGCQLSRIWRDTWHSRFQLQSHALTHTQEMSRQNLIISQHFLLMTRPGPFPESIVSLRGSWSPIEVDGRWASTDALWRYVNMRRKSSHSTCDKQLILNQLVFEMDVF